MRLIDADNLFNNKIIVVSNSDQLEAIEKIMDIIKEAPTIEAEPIRHGKWIHTGFMEVKCSDCGNVFHELEDTNYCPNCGAKMIPTIPKEIIDAVLGEDEVNDEDN